MLRVIIALVLVLGTPLAARAALVEAPPDDPRVVSLRTGQIAMAPHPGADLLAYAWVVKSGAGTTDLQAAVIDANVPSAPVYLQDYDAGDFQVRDPAVAFDAQSGLFLVVWVQDTGTGGGALEVFGRFFDLLGASPGPPFAITSAGVDPNDPAFDAVQPDVAADGTGEFRVVWAADDDVFGFGDGAFEIYHRTVAAGTGALGPVNTILNTFSSVGGAALHPQIEFMPWNGGYFLTYEGDSTADPNLFAPLIYAETILPGAPRGGASVIVSGSTAARRNSYSGRNPSLAVDRQNQRIAIVWDFTPGPASSARAINGAIFTDALAVDQIFTARDLDALGAGPLSYVRDPDVTHSRIAGRFVIVWRESLNLLSGNGQALLAREFDETIGFDAPPLNFVTQAPAPPVGGEPDFGPPKVLGGSHNNGRVFATWASNVSAPIEFFPYVQGFDTEAATAAPPDLIPREFGLALAPNPFNPRTSIALSLPVAGRAQVDIYDLRGRLVRRLLDENLPAGLHQRIWEGNDDGGRQVSSGVYLVRLRHPGAERVVKATLVE